MSTHRRKRNCIAKSSSSSGLRYDLSLSESLHKCSDWTTKSNITLLVTKNPNVDIVTVSISISNVYIMTKWVKKCSFTAVQAFKSRKRQKHFLHI